MVFAPPYRSAGEPVLVQLSNVRLSPIHIHQFLEVPVLTRPTHWLVALIVSSQGRCRGATLICIAVLGLGTGVSRRGRWSPSARGRGWGIRPESSPVMFLVQLGEQFSFGGYLAPL